MEEVTDYPDFLFLTITNTLQSTTILYQLMDKYSKNAFWYTCKSISMNRQHTQ